MKRKFGYLIASVLFLSLVACGKNTERQIAKQLELGQKYLMEGNYDQAIIAYSRAIEIEPKSEQAYIKLASVLLELERYDEAIKILEKGNHEIPDSEEILSQLEYQFPSVTASLEPGTYDERKTLELNNENEFEIYYRIVGDEGKKDMLYETAIDLGANGTYEISYYAVNPEAREGRQYHETYKIKLDPQKYIMNQWVQKNGEWYYYDTNGYLALDWQVIDGKWFYFYEDGIMAHDVWVNDYYLGSDGEWMQEVQPAPNKNNTGSYSNIMMSLDSGSDWNNIITSRAIKKDGYYEITNVDMYVYDILPKEKVEQLKIGDPFPKYGVVYELVSIDRLWGMLYYFFDSKEKYSGTNYYLRECDEGYYQITDGDCIEVKVIYTGSIYISLDCKISIMDFNAENGMRNMSTEEWVASGLQRGHGGGHGDVVLDKAGYVVEYSEFFSP